MVATRESAMRADAFIHPANFTALTPLSFLQRAGEVFANKTAIIYGSRRLTYSDFVAETERLARAIKNAIKPGGRVAFLAPNVPELLIAHFAVALAGGVLVAINSRLAEDEVIFILQHSEATLLFVDAEYAAGITSVRESCPTLRRIVEIPDIEFGLGSSDADIGQVAYDTFVAESGGSSTLLRWDIDDEQTLLSINYTSGTTGRPKGVMYSHRGGYLNAMGEMHHNGFTSDSRYLWTLPMFHCNGWCTPWAVTAAGATHVCLRAVTPDAVWAAIDDLGITNLCGAPTVCSVIANAQEAHPPAGSLRITTAGAPPSPTIIEQLEALGITVVHVYGLTEVYGPSTICEYQLEWGLLDPASRAVKIARQGVAMVHGDPVRVVDEQMNDVPRDGVTLGEIVLRGNIVMLGYHNNAAATDEAFRGGWFHSGDLGVMHEDGYVELKDRAKDIIISGGENISTIEVENALTSHPAVLDAAVVGYPSEKWGERPKAYVLLRPERSISSDELREHARRSIAKFKVPDYIVFVETLPRTATGKVTKTTLRNLSDVPN
jgi:fatty-acyl-CoA synthase